MIHFNPAKSESKHPTKVQYVPLCYRKFICCLSTKYLIMHLTIERYVLLDYLESVYITKYNRRKANNYMKRESQSYIYSYFFLPTHLPHLCRGSMRCLWIRPFMIQFTQKKQNCIESNYFYLFITGPNNWFGTPIMNSESYQIFIKQFFYKRWWT